MILSIVAERNVQHAHIGR